MRVSKKGKIRNEEEKYNSSLTIIGIGYTLIAISIIALIVYLFIK